MRMPSLDPPSPLGKGGLERVEGLEFRVFEVDWIKRRRREAIAKRRKAAVKTLTVWTAKRPVMKVPPHRIMARMSFR